MPAHDLWLDRRNRLWDLGGDGVDWLRCRLAWLLLAHIGDFKPIALNQWFLRRVGVNCRGYRLFVGCLSGRCFGNPAYGHRAEQN